MNAKMGRFDGVINAANREINKTNLFLQSQETPFNVMYKQYKTIQKLWLRMVEEAADANSRQLESLCIELEEYVQQCSDWLKENSPAKKQEDVAYDEENEIE